MKITTGCRAHLGLLDLHGGIGRIDGGVGISLDNPGLSITAEPSDELSVSGPLSNRVQAGAEDMLECIDGSAANIQIEQGIPQHVGLGSGTQAKLAGACVISNINNESYSVNELARITGRGGTSGIGTAAFDNGGVIFDGGHDFETKGDYLPSAASDVPPPPVISRLTFPDWDMRLFIPEGEGVHGSDEIDVFAEECPIPDEEVAELCRLVTMKFLPSIKRSNFTDFRDCLANMQDIGFKSRELSRQPKSRKLVQTLHDKGCAAGMSSFGPTVLAVHPESVNDINTTCMSLSTKPDQSGAEVS